MFDYKEVSFYNEYFNGLTDFKLVEEFDVCKELGKNNLFVGKIEAVDTIHPLIIDVDIPQTFPHHKLVFKTTSLFGYPHLIPEGGIGDKSWFCLNTPFAETAEGQLNLELERLREWICRQMRDDLPSIISDPEFIKALRLINAYSWENTDEMNEFKQDAQVTFVGEISCNPKDYETKRGHFHSVRNNSGRCFVLKNKLGTNYEIPWIIVEEMPIYWDFFELKKQYQWDEDTCRFLLPGYEFDKKEKVSSSFVFCPSVFSKEKALNIVEELDNELDKGEAFILTQTNYQENEGCVYKAVPNCHIPLIKKELPKLKKEIQKNKNWNYREKVRSVDEYYLDESEAWQNRIGNSVRHPNVFCLGFVVDNSIFWMSYSTNMEKEKYETIIYTIIEGEKVKKESSAKTLRERIKETLCYGNGLRSDIEISRFVGLRLKSEKPQIITPNEFWGRGKLCSCLTDKKIAIMGVGAIGSVLAESLVRSGCTELDLWDGDYVEVGNICRSFYGIEDLGNSKAEALSSKLQRISPFCKIRTNGMWYYDEYQNGEFYGQINYIPQQHYIDTLKKYDIIIDCTASNELLHFMSYACPEKLLLSLCITNHSQNLLVLSSKNGNPFELRKHFLSKIEQDTQNFYAEGSGCYSPTFLAKNCDIAALVQLAIKDINDCMESGQQPLSCIYSYSKRGIITDRLVTYRLDDKDLDIRLVVSTETIYDGEDLPDKCNGSIGYLLGGYSSDGKQIMLTHFISSDNAEEYLNYAYEISGGIIDYIGDFVYSDGETGSYKDADLNTIVQKALDPTINTNNPLLAIRNTDNSISYFLYINGVLTPFIQTD